MREAWGLEEDLWGAEALPRVSWLWKKPEVEQEEMRMMGGPTLQADVLPRWGGDLITFEPEVDGMTGARAFFDAIAPARCLNPAPSSASRKRPREA